MNEDFSATLQTQFGFVASSRCHRDFPSTKTGSVSNLKGNDSIEMIPIMIRNLIQCLGISGWNLCVSVALVRKRGQGAH